MKRRVVCMNYIKFLLLAALAALAFGGIGCDGDDLPEVAPHNAPAQALKENNWKLVGIMDAQTGSLKELKPKDCGRWVCYMLTFDTDTKISFFAGVNDGFGNYNYDYETHSFHIVDDFNMSEVGADHTDEELWLSILKAVKSFSLLENELRLYYNENRNYLFFKSQSK